MNLLVIRHNPGSDIIHEFSLENRHTGGFLLELGYDFSRNYQEAKVFKES